MKVSAKSEYACIAALELARRHPESGPVRVRDIALEHGIPARFLVQILLQLKAAGLVASTRGASGGYQLARPPDQITLGDVMSVIERPESIPQLSAPRSPTARVLLRTWREITALEQQALGEITLADLVERVRGEVGQMYYI